MLGSAGSGQIIIVTQATVDNWQHLTGLARAYARQPSLEADRYRHATKEIARGGDEVRGGTGAEVAAYAAQQLASLTENTGGWTRYLGLLPRISDAVWRTLAVAATGQVQAITAAAGRLAAEDPEALAAVLGVLGTITAMVDPRGIGPGHLVLDATVLPPWQDRPDKIPDWRRQLVRRWKAPETVEATANALLTGGYDLMPAFADPLAAARVLCSEEAERLGSARLYHVDAVTGAVAARKASRPRVTPIGARRVPAARGMVVFAEPVEFAPGCTPLVAASWGQWKPDASWFTRTNNGLETLTGLGGRAWWLTLYAHSASIPPMDVASVGVVSEHYRFEQPPAARSMEFAARIVVACWDLITQGLVGTPVTTINETRRQPSKLRADRRGGVTDDGTVRLVTLTARRPALESTEPGPAASTTTGGRRYDRGRWRVTEHTRSHCMNPAAHADGGCTHEDITILDHEKGPADKPFLDTVYQLKAR